MYGQGSVSVMFATARWLPDNILVSCPSYNHRLWTRFPRVFCDRLFISWDLSDGSQRLTPSAGGQILHRNLYPGMAHISMAHIDIALYFILKPDITSSHKPIFLVFSHSAISSMIETKSCWPFALDETDETWVHRWITLPWEQTTVLFPTSHTWSS